MKVEKIKRFGFNCVKLTGKETEVVVTTDVGPRILGLYHAGGENHMCVFKETEGVTGGDKFTAYGGHRIWHAPEEPVRTYFPDNEKVEVFESEDGVTFLSFEKETFIRKGFHIFIDDTDEITVTHIMKNEGHFDIELSLWGLTQLQNGGLMVIPNSTLDTGLVANRVVSLWPYSKMNDKRVYFGDKFITITPDSNAETPFKLGVSLDSEYAAYFNFNQMVVKRFNYYFEADYPNFACNFETYTWKHFIEFESLSPMMTLEAGEMETHVEKWRVFNNVAKPVATNEAEIEKTIKKYLKD